MLPPSSHQGMSIGIVGKAVLSRERCRRLRSSKFDHSRGHSVRRQSLCMRPPLLDPTKMKRRHPSSFVETVLFQFAEVVLQRSSAPATGSALHPRLRSHHPTAADYIFMRKIAIALPLLLQIARSIMTPIYVVN